MFLWNFGLEVFWPESEQLAPKWWGWTMGPGDSYEISISRKCEKIPFTEINMHIPRDDYLLMASRGPGWKLRNGSFWFYPFLGAPAAEQLFRAPPEIHRWRQSFAVGNLGEQRWHMYRGPRTDGTCSRSSGKLPPNPRHRRLVVTHTFSVMHRFWNRVKSEPGYLCC